MENVGPPIDLSTPMLLIKPQASLPTPSIFKALDLNGLSVIDPLDLLSELRTSRRITQELCVNDLETPAFLILPELLELKERLIKEGNFEAVFMTGSGSTIVCFGSDTVPEFLKEAPFKDLFIHSARLIAREPGQWYMPSLFYEAATV